MYQFLPKEQHQSVTTVVRVLWLVLAGIWLALAYALAGALSGLVTGGGAVTQAALRMAAYALWPFGRTLVSSDDAAPRATEIAWMVTAGWWLALVHAVVGVLLCLTVVGMPFGVASLTLLPLSLRPLRAEIQPVRARLGAARAPAGIEPTPGRVLTGALAHAA